MRIVRVSHLDDPGPFKPGRVVIPDGAQPWDPLDALAPYFTASEGGAEN